ncbi:MAG TPA: hypothetical protein VJ183_19615 [Chloroflexia bacterium]|nr:hypothetical protein [Chloroflexia bacterium]
MLDVALITYSELPGLAEDEQLLAATLAGLGMKAGAAVWDDPVIDWAGIGVCVIRSTWDYHHRLEEFMAWAEHVASLSSLWNPVEVVRWNTRKTYLRELAERDISVVPTVWLARGSKADLATLMAEQGWQRVVVKPVVSASAYATMLVADESLREGQAHLDKLLAERDMMVQPFIASVETSGERSLMFIDGHFTHAVRRTFPLGSNQDGQEKSRLVEATRTEIGFAASVLQAAGHPTLYARVDVVRDEAGALCLMELELVEPSLFLQMAPEAVESLAGAIADRLPPRPRNQK